MVDKIFEYDMTFYIACSFTERVMIFEIENELHGISSPDGDVNRFEIHVPNTKSLDIYEAVTRRVKMYPGNNKLFLYLDDNIVVDRYECRCVNPVLKDNPRTQTNVPISAFTVNTTLGKPEKIFSFTDTSSNEPNRWLWDFGDGITSTLQNPDHHYLLTGIYTVSLTTWNSVGECVSPLIMDSFIIVSNTPDVPQTSFTVDTTYGESPVLINITNETRGKVTSWLWDFGDGLTATEQNPPAHTFVKPKRYTVTLTATNDFGSTSHVEKIDVIGIAVTVIFSSDKTSVDAGEIVAFTNGGYSPNSIKSVIDYGDGTTALVSGNFTSGTHVYTKGGSYTPKLVVTDKYGVEHTQTAATITVTVPTSTANFTIEPSSGTKPLTVKFTNTSTIFQPTKMILDWGYGKYDGVYTEEPITTTFTNSGNQDVALHILDSTGAWISTTKTVYISEPTQTYNPISVTPITPSALIPPSIITPGSVDTNAGYKYHIRISGFKMDSRYATGFWCGSSGSEYAGIDSDKIMLPKGYYDNYGAYIFQDMVIVRQNGLVGCNYMIHIAGGFVGLIVEPPAGQPNDTLENLDIFFGKTEHSGFMKTSLNVTQVSYDHTQLILPGYWILT